jgi:hypothetical protein
MVKDIKEKGMAGALEFENFRKDDPQLQVRLEEHRARNGGKLRVGLGGKGVRVACSTRPRVLARLKSLSYDAP